MKAHDDLGVPMFDDKTPEALESDYCKLKRSYVEKVLPGLEAGGGVVEALECAELTQHFKKYLRRIEAAREEMGSDEEAARSAVEKKLQSVGGAAMVQVDVRADEAGSIQLGALPETDAARRFSFWRLRRSVADEAPPDARREYAWLSDVGFVFVFHRAADVRELCQRRRENQEEEPEQHCVTITVRLPDLGDDGEAPLGFVDTHDVPAYLGEAAAKEFVKEFLRKWRVKCGLAEGFGDYTLECVEVDGLARVLEVAGLNQNQKTFIDWLNLAEPGSVSAVILQVTSKSLMDVDPPKEVAVSNEQEWDGEWLRSLDSIKIFPPQRHVAERILCRMEHVLKAFSPGGLGGFTNLAFVIILPTFRSLRDQTLERVKQLYRGGGETVIMFGASGNAAMDKFATRATTEPRTLFVVIDDESHWNVNKGGVHCKWVNDARLCGSANVLILLCSATPYNNLTRESRIPATTACFGAAGTSICDQGEGVEEELHVTKWFGKVKAPGAYRRLEDYLRTIESAERHVNLAVPGLREFQTIRGEGSPSFFDELQIKDDKQGHKALLVDYMLSFAYVARVRCEGEVGQLRLAAQPMRPEDVTLAKAEAVLETFTKMIDSCRQLTGIKDKALQVLGGLHGGSDDGNQNLQHLASLSMVDLIKNKLRDERNEAGVVLAGAGVYGLSESDRIVMDVLDTDATDASNRRERSLEHGRMKVVRVFSREQSDCMYSLFKKCRNTLFGDEAFAVMMDNSKVSLADAIEAKFARRIDNFKAVRASVNFETLKDWPCFLFLVEKGRMGDTFPPSMNCLDMRIRASDNVVTLIQELGRLSRHPLRDESSAALSVSAVGRGFRGTNFTGKFPAWCGLTFAGG
ncbi:hypothetical protein T484DRAFT_1895221, partial [Baffinella frigidus]